MRTAPPSGPKAAPPADQLQLNTRAFFSRCAVLFAFLDVVLDWRSTWLNLLWSEALDLSLLFAFALRVLPTPAHYEIHFLPLRPTGNTQLSTDRYSRFFRWLLGSAVDAARADEAVARDAATRARARHQSSRLAS